MSVPANLTPPRPELLAPAWRERWCLDRGLQLDWFVSELERQFLPDGDFYLITHDATGQPRKDLSVLVRKDGEPKYKAPKDCGIVIYAPLPNSWVRWREAKTKYLVEGHGKTIALVGLGLPALGFPGIEAWHRGKGDFRLHADLTAHLNPGDHVVVIPDGDWRRNGRVARGASGLLHALREAGAASSEVLDLSEQPVSTGIDDLIVFWRGQKRDPLVEFARLPRLDRLTGPAVVCTPASEILARSPARWIVKDLIPAGELVAIVGATNSGKTFLTMDLLLAVATAQPEWFGHKIRRSGPTVHVTLEGTGLPYRLRAYVRDRPAPDYFAVETPVNLREPDTADSLIAAIKEATPRPVLVAVDTVNRALGGGDENSSTDMGAFLGNCERIKAAFPDSTVVLVHHLGKDEARGARGHSSFSANIGAELNVSNDDKTGIRTVKLEKQRDGRTDVQFNFTLNPVAVGKDEDGDEITSCVVAISAASPARNDTLNYETIYSWIFRWYIGDQNKGQPVSKERVKDHLLNVRPKSDKTTKPELEAVFLWAIDKGLAVINAEATAKLRRGTAYDLKPLPEKKY